jgi:hypothetical protein
VYIATAVCLAYPFSRSVPTLMFLSFCLGQGLRAGQPMVMSVLHRHAPPGTDGRGRGRADFADQLDDGGRAAGVRRDGPTLAGAMVGRVFLATGGWLTRRGKA